MRIKLTKEEKSLAFAAENAAFELRSLWVYMNEDRSNDKDFEAARKCTETLVTFGRMIEEKLRLESEETPKPQPEETSPETVKTSNPSAESTECGCGSDDSGSQETRKPSDVGLNEVTSGKAPRGFFQRLFHRA